MSRLRSFLGALRRIPSDVRLFLVMLALIGVARVIHTAYIRGMYVDGGYYAEVARHVRDGQGLTTHISLYHFGYEYFPHPTSVYPLWPWLLGMTAKVVDLEVAAHWLPLACAFVAIVAAFLFGRALWPEPVFPAHIPGFHAGHVFAIGLAVHHEFVVFTSLPYTEGISWALTFLFLWRAVRKGPDTSIAWAIETGVWLGLMYLARFQLVVAPMAAACAYLARVVLGPDRLRVALHASIALLVAGLFLGGWFLYMRDFVPGATLSSLLRFDQNRANDLLTPVDVIVENHGLLDLVLDRLQGFRVAWDPLADGSYQGSYYTLHWSLAIALPLVLAQVLRALVRRGPRAVLEELRRPENAHWWMVGIFALGGLLSIHAIHKHYYGAWYFTKRQGLMSLPAFLLPLGWLLRQHVHLPRLGARLATVGGVLVLATTTVRGTYTLLEEANQRHGEMRKGDRYAAIGDWLQKQVELQGPLAVAMDATLVQRIAWKTRDVGYHWIDGPTPYRDLLVMNELLGARYVIFRNAALKEEDWTIFQESKVQFERDFELVAGRPEGFMVYQRRRPGSVIRPAPPALPAPPVPDGGEPMEEEEP
jgi:hypothetical protein